MYFLYQKKIRTKLNFKPVLQFGSNNRVLTIQLFGPNYSNSSNSIWNQKMNEYEYQIPLFGPNYSNS